MRTLKPAKTEAEIFSIFLQCNTFAPLHFLYSLLEVTVVGLKQKEVNWILERYEDMNFIIHGK
jgi:hypothetical protein